MFTQKSHLQNDDDSLQPNSWSMNQQTNGVSTDNKFYRIQDFFNTMGPDQNSQHFPDDFFKWISFLF